MGHNNAPIQGQDELLRAVRLIWQRAVWRPANPAAAGGRGGSRFKNISHGGQLKATSSTVHERGGRIQLHLVGMKFERKCLLVFRWQRHQASLLSLVLLPELEEAPVFHLLSPL